MFSRVEYEKEFAFSAKISINLLNRVPDEKGEKEIYDKRAQTKQHPCVSPS
jgi:hypothetical protein